MPGQPESIMNDRNVNIVCAISQENRNDMLGKIGINKHFENVNISLSVQQFIAAPHLFQMDFSPPYHKVQIRTHQYFVWQQMFQYNPHFLNI